MILSMGRPKTLSPRQCAVCTQYDGTTFVEDVVRGQWSALEREQRLLQAATADNETCRRYQIWFEQEPGSGGKESAEASSTSAAAV